VCDLIDVVGRNTVDGRHVTNTNISEYINNLPDGADTRHFSTGNASGSTSMAANIAEAVEAGGDALLIDEDESATNFMFRDATMAQLVAHEPITPFLAKIRALADARISSVLVLGSSSCFFQFADFVIKMDGYLPVVVTEQAKQLAKQAYVVAV
jgi:predicted ABC-class ATPase